MTTLPVPMTRLPASAATAGRKPRVGPDWPRLLLDLRARGVTMAHVARHLGVGHSTVRDWAVRGAQPKYTDGQALLDLWKRVMLATREPAPIRMDEREAECG